MKKRTEKKIFAILFISTLAFLLASVPASAKNRKAGARIKVDLTDGRSVEGELLTVKAQSFIVANPTTMTTDEVAVGEIGRIRVMKKSKAFAGAGIGFISGALSGAALGLISGNDSGGIIRFTAGQKAGIGALALGAVGAVVGIIVHGFSGLGQNIDWANMAQGDREHVLRKLRAMSRFPQENAVPASYSPAALSRESAGGLPPAKTVRLSQPSSKAEARSKSRPRFCRFHIGITPAYFKTSAIKGLKRTLETADFGDTRYMSAWGVGTFSIEYPHVAMDRAFCPVNLHLEYSLTSKWALGFLFARFGRHGVDGYRALKGLDYRGYDSDCYISERYGGNAYFLTAAFYPIPDGFVRKYSVRLGSGLGLVRTHYSFWDPSFLSQASGAGGATVSRNTLAIMTFAEIQYFFNRTWSLGLTADYKYLPLKIEAAGIRSAYSYYPSSGGDVRIESLYVSLPEQNLNLGGFSFGLSLRIHM